MKKIAILGATGSVGTQTVDVAKYLKNEIEVVCISANTNWSKAVNVANELRPQYIVMGDKYSADKVRSHVCYNAHVYEGFDFAVSALKESGIDFVVLAISGVQGISVFEYCLKNNIDVGLANKEAVVCGGSVIRDMMRLSSSKIYPIDSEHSAIYQCLKNSFDTKGVKNLLLTASGGPFFGKNADELRVVIPEMALKHPNWSMGKKITIDSATLANKGQEVIEARYLFDIDAKKIKVIVHPQSIVHSMVEYIDGSIMAQLGPVDMRLPIQRALTEDTPYQNGLWTALDLTKIKTLSFFNPDMETFRCLKLAYMAAGQGGAATAVYAVADEVAVDLFLSGKIGFLDISDVIEDALNSFSDIKCKSVDDILHINDMVRVKLQQKYFGL